MIVATFSFLNEKSYNKTVIDFNFGRHKDLSEVNNCIILHENRLLADDSHEISCLICYFLKSGKICNKNYCRLLQITDGALRVKDVFLSKLK